MPRTRRPTAAFSPRQPSVYLLALFLSTSLAAAQPNPDRLVLLDGSTTTGTITSIDPDGHIVNSSYSSGPIGRFTANEVLKKTIFEQAKANG